MGREQNPRQIKLEKHASNWTHARFGGVDERLIGYEPVVAAVETPTRYEQLLDEFDGDPRLVATHVEMQRQGFPMQPGIQYEV
jgi:hypothetical protein